MLLLRGTAGLPEYLIANYWVDVQLELTTRFGLTAPDAAAVVRDYRRKLEEREMGELIYHSNATDLADALGEGWRNGFYRTDASKVPA